MEISMKKIIFIILMLCFPSVIFGKEIFYSANDISLNIHEDWYVFTKDNIENNSKLDELGLDYEEYNKYMNDENIILSGLLFYTDNSDIIEIAIQKKEEIPEDISYHIIFI